MPAKQKKKPGGGGVLWDPGSTLSGRKLKRASKKLAGLEVNPEIKGYRRLANELKAESKAQASGLEQLGARAGANIQSSYQGLAQAEAQNVARQAAIRNMLTQQSGQIAGDAQTQQNTAQQGQLGGYLGDLQARGAPGGGQAQQALADMVAAQRARLATTNAAAQQSAVAQGAGNTAFAANQATANQTRGAEAQSGLQSTIASRVSQSNLRYGQDTREALGKLAEAKAKRGPVRTAKLLELRSGERDYTLGKAAVKIDKAEAKESARAHRVDEQTDQQRIQNEIARIEEQARHNEISEAQANRRIKQAKKRLKADKRK